MDVTVAPAYPSRAEFTAQVGTDFRGVADDGRTVSVRLAAVEEGFSTPSNEQFALQLHAPAEVAPAQGLYHLEHDALSPMDLFLVPTGRQGDTLVLEAVFNRFVAVEKED